MKNQIRAFVAVDLSPSVRQSVGKLIKQLEETVEGTKWVEPKDLHVTLKFLGDVPLNDLHRIIEAVKRGTESVEAFDLEFSGCGAFPDTKNPRTVWIGCEQGTEELSRLALSIENELFGLGFPKEQRRFSPHLTIGRIKQGNVSVEDLRAFLESKESQVFGSCGVDEVIVYSSELTRSGPIYGELATLSLR